MFTFREHAALKVLEAISNDNNCPKDMHTIIKSLGGDAPTYASALGANIYRGGCGWNSFGIDDYVGLLVKSKEVIEDRYNSIRFYHLSDRGIRNLRELRELERAVN